MPSQEGRGTAKGKSKPTLQELEHVRNKHLRINFDRDKDLVQLHYVHNCGDKDCSVPHTSFTLSLCPTNPCPPGSSGNN